MIIQETGGGGYYLLLSCQEYGDKLPGHCEITQHTCQNSGTKVNNNSGKCHFLINCHNYSRQKRSKTPIDHIYPPFFAEHYVLYKPLNTHFLHRQGKNSTQWEDGRSSYVRFARTCLLNLIKLCVSAFSLVFVFMYLFTIFLQSIRQSTSSFHQPQTDKFK